MHFSAPECNKYPLFMQIGASKTATARCPPPAFPLSGVCFLSVGSKLATCCVRSRSLQEAFRMPSGRISAAGKRPFFCQHFATALTFFTIGCSGFKISGRHHRRAETGPSRAACRAKCHFVRRPKNLPRTFHVPELFTTFVA